MTAARLHAFAHQAMATTFEVRVAHEDARYAGQAAQACFAVADRLEGLLSRFDPNSEIAQVNRLAPGEALTLAGDSCECLRIALAVHELTGGAFDPTLGAELDRRRGAGPALGQDGPRGRLLLDPTTRVAQVLDGAVALDLGAIGKGFALDRMAEVLREWDLECALLLAGGGSSLLALAGPTPGEAWEVGFGVAASTHFGRLEHRALGASGTTVQGRHILDPRTREPASGAWRAWVFAASAAEADAFSTACMVLEAEDVAELCRRREDLGVILLPRPDAGFVTFGRVPVLEQRPSKP